MENYIDASKVSLWFFDACPSEFFVLSDSKVITHAGIHFFMIYKPGLKQIPQFKDSRRVRKQFWLQYLQENIENKKIGFYCLSFNTPKFLGIQNGYNFLVKENIVHY